MLASPNHGCPRSPFTCKELVSLKIYPDVYTLMEICGLCSTYIAAYFSFVNATSLDNTAQYTQKHKLRLDKQGENCLVAAMPFNYTVVPLNQQFIVLFLPHVHTVKQKSMGLIFRTSHSSSDVQYSCHHNSSHFTFPIFAHLWHFSVFHSSQSVTLRIY
jgi:hypothetical protein